MEVLLSVVIVVAILLIVVLVIYMYSMYQYWKGRHERAELDKKIEKLNEESRRKDLGYDDD
jgi:cell division protein FtsL